MSTSILTEVKERPLLCCAEMVRAILEDRKTQTRRVVKPQPEEVGFGRNCKVAPYCTGTDWPLAYYERRGGGIWNSSSPLKTHFQPGTRLWVKETWHPQKSNRGPVTYRATWKDEDPDEGWKPSIFMPRWASRITLEITDIRVERLQDISEEDAKVEGVGAEFEMHACDFIAGAPVKSTFKLGFKHVWEKINGKKHPWSINPFVWVIEFRRLDTAVKPQ